MRTSPLLNRPGAVASAPDDPDQAVPAHLGDPGREQAALAEGRAVCALARDVVTVAGPDRLSWLTTLSSQVLTGLEPGDGGWPWSSPLPAVLPGSPAPAWPPATRSAPSAPCRARPA